MSTFVDSRERHLVNVGITVLYAIGCFVIGAMAAVFFVYILIKHVDDTPVLREHRKSRIVGYVLALLASLGMTALAIIAGVPANDAFTRTTFFVLNLMIPTILGVRALQKWLRDQKQSKTS